MKELPDFERKSEKLRYRTRARGYKGRGRASATKLRRLWEEQDGQCAMCGRQLRNDQQTTIDHIIRLKDGGTNAIENLRWLCKRCNRGREKRHRRHKSRVYRP